MMILPTVVHELTLTVWNENRYTEGDTTEVDLDDWCGTARPTVGPRTSCEPFDVASTWRAREEDYLKGEVHGIALAIVAEG